MSAILKFEEMERWQKARTIAKTVYLLSEKEKLLRDYGLRD
jgi:hypothetical protein